MTRARPKFMPAPRVLGEHNLATLMGMCETTLRERRPRLEAEGFPHIDELLGGTDAAAVHRWLDQRAGLGAVDPDQEIEAWQP